MFKDKSQEGKKEGRMEGGEGEEKGGETDN